MKKRLLLIDCQVFQTMAWHRGMGKYSFELIKSSAKDLSQIYEKIILVFSKNEDLSQEARDALEEVFKGINNELKFIDLKSAMVTKDINISRKHNKTVLDKYVGSFGKKNTDYLILCLFLDNAPVYPSNSKKLLLFYDSIPFLFADKYKDRINFEHYLSHYSIALESDIIFTISQTVADDLSIYFGISNEKLVNINGAYIGNSEATISEPDIIDEDIKFILAPTGDELRKNNLRAVQGFELFNLRHSNKYKLVFTSFFSDFTKNQLNRLSNNLIFTGNIPPSELNWLYANADAVLFPSEYEGLGLPILEAVNHGKKIACSAIPVFREISKNAFEYFDPKSPEEISRALTAIVKETWIIDDKEYKRIEHKYTWERTAELVHLTLKDYKSSNEYTTKKKKLAILCPDPCGYSAIGKVVAETHYELSQFFDIDYYYEKGPEHKYLRPDFLKYVANNTYDVTDFNSQTYSEYDMTIYHIGNSEYHLVTIANALRFPGIAIFHDTHLERAFEQLYELNIINSGRLLIEQAIDDKLKTKKSKFLNSIASRQIAVVAHSKYAEKAIRETGTTTQVEMINLPTSTPASIDRVSTSSIKIGLAGIIAGVKGIQLIDDIVRSRFSSEIEIVVFGYIQSPELMDRVEAIPGVTLIANPTDFEFQSQLANIDILLNYRMQYNGETSLTVIEAMRHGCTVVVRDIGWYSELPDDAVIKVKSVDAAVEAVQVISLDNYKRNKISLSAAEYVKINHSHLDYAKKINYIISNIDKSNSPNIQIYKMIINKQSQKKISEYISEKNQ